MKKDTGRVWINFKELRAKLSFEDILAQYGVKVNRRGEQHVGPCPLPLHSGTRESAAFSANLEKGIFQCFGCKAKGNVLEFAALMEKVDVSNGHELREVAVRLQGKYFPEGASVRTRTRDATPAAKPVEQSELSIHVNAPLDFELKDLDFGHEYLSSRGLAAETMRAFGAGFCARGSLAGRIAIPLNDATGKLVGYAGRIVDEGRVSAKVPRDWYPEKRERGGVALEFRKDRILYNAHQQKPTLKRLVVVEDFASVWWLSQNGLPEAVATMGADCSDDQAELITSLVAPECLVWIVQSGNPDGERFGRSVLDQLAPYRFVRLVKLGEGRHPTDLPAATLKADFGL